MATANTFDALGALEIGTFIALFLFGVITLQVFTYFHKFPHDPATFKALVSSVWLLELGHTICITHTIYTSSIRGPPINDEAFTLSTTIIASLLIGGWISTLVQTFYTTRIHKTLSLPFLAYPCYALILARIVGCIAIAVFAFMQGPSPSSHRFKYTWLMTAWLGVGAALDTAIAGAMGYYVSKQLATQVHTDGPMKVVDRVLTWTFQTGVIMGIAAVAILVCSILLPHSLIWLGIYTYLINFYPTSLLTSLNSRRRIRKYTNTLPSSLRTRTHSSSDTQVGDELPHELPNVRFSRHSRNSSHLVDLSKYHTWERSLTNFGIQLDNDEENGLVAIPVPHMPVKSLSQRDVYGR